MDFEISFTFVFIMVIIMTTIELKKLMIHRITEINDVSFLKAVKTILDSKKDTEMLILSAEQRGEIMQLMKEIEQGQYIEHESLDKEVSRWANAR